jgi:hypothetical protein
MRTRHGIAAIALAALMMLSAAGCGTPGAPQPPSLNLPDRVDDLAATRVGNQVSLTWTMPKRNTDRIPLKGSLDVEICRKQGGDFSATLCEPAGKVQLAPASAGAFSDTLPIDAVAGPLRKLTYFVEIKNQRGRSAGLSNPAVVLAGQSPSPVTGFAAELRKPGVVLRWNPADPGASVRLRRKLLTPPPAKPRTGPLPNAAAPVEQSLLVEASADATPAQALDNHIDFGSTYEYRAQRVVHIQVDDKTIEIQGELSSPVRIDAVDVFPPAVPQGLAAVAIAAGSNAAASIDLSWQPNVEPDLAGYEVYRREDTTPWQRISGDQPVPGPAFHDAHVLPGHTYRYGVTAVDKQGHESGRSTDAAETVPNN